jgi:nanoRNase/pAp phosphatase (c-di-AMP/oligoRNAs hydrolase)
VVKDLVEQATKVTLPTGEIGLAVNCSPQFSSDVGHKLALLSGTFGCTWQVENFLTGGAKFSLRSNGDYDVSAIAKANGGGGHKNAAGFYMSYVNFHDWCAV